MLKDKLKNYIEEAKNVAHTICIPVEEVSMDELVYLVKEAKKEKVEIRLWHETSNAHQGILVEVQRFKDRTDSSVFKNVK